MHAGKPNGKDFKGESRNIKNQEANTRFIRAARTAFAERLTLLERVPVSLVVDLSRIEDHRKPDFMTRYELRKIVSHHQDWLRGEREGIAGSVYAANQRGHFGAIVRNPGPAPSTPRAQRQRHPHVGLI